MGSSPFTRTSRPLLGPAFSCGDGTVVYTSIRKSGGDIGREQKKSPARPGTDV